MSPLSPVLAAAILPVSKSSREEKSDGDETTTINQRRMAVSLPAALPWDVTMPGERVRTGGHGQNKGPFKELPLFQILRQMCPLSI